MSKLNTPVTAEDHAQGDPGAKCTLIEYGDYQCPACGEAYPIVKRLQKHFGNDLLFVFRNFPLSQMHPDAEHAAETAEFAAAHGKFWEMHDLLYENQQNLEEEALLSFASQLNLPADKLREDLQAGTYRSRVRADFGSGVHSGVNGTPTFFIDGQRHDDSFDYETLSAAVEQQINTAR